MADLCLSDFREIGAVDRVNLEQAIVVVSGVVFRSVRAVPHCDGYMFAIVRHCHAFRRLSDADRVNDTGRLRFEINDVDNVCIALPTTLIAENSNIALRTDFDAVRPNAADHEHLAVFDLVGVHRQDRNLVIAIAGYQSHFSVRRERNMARA